MRGFIDLLCNLQNKKEPTLFEAAPGINDIRPLLLKGNMSLSFGYEEDPAEVADEAGEVLERPEKSSSSHHRVMLETPDLDVELLGIQDDYTPVGFYAQLSDLDETGEIYRNLASDMVPDEGTTYHDANFYRQGDLPDLKLTYAEGPNENKVYGGVKGDNIHSRLDDIEDITDLRIIEDDFQGIFDEVVPGSHDVTGEAGDAIRDMKTLHYVQKLLKISDRFLPGDRSMDLMTYNGKMAQAMPEYREEGVEQVNLVEGLNNLSDDYSQIVCEVNGSGVEKFHLEIDDSQTPNTIAAFPSPGNTFLKDAVPELEELWEQTVSGDAEINAHTLETYPGHYSSVTERRLLNSSEYENTI